MPRQQFATRPWRAIHDSWLSSERLGAASDQAIILWHMLNTRQDDAGRFHWTRIRVLTLVAVRGWTYEEATEHLSELARVGSVTVSGEWVTLHRGDELNGTPHSGSKESMIPRFYPGYTDGIPQVERNDIDGTTRQVETRQVERAATPPLHKPITPEYLDALQAAYPTLHVREELANAQNRKQWGDYVDKRKHFENWLKRSLKYAAAAPTNSNGSKPSSPGKPPPIWLPSMGEQHKGPGGMVKACGVPGCLVPICLVPPPRKHEAEARFKERLLKVAGENAQDMLSLGQERTVAPR